MPYFVVLLPFLFVCGVIGAMVSLVRGRPRSAVVFLLVGVGAAGISIALYHSAL